MKFVEHPAGQLLAAIALVGCAERPVARDDQASVVEDQTLVVDVTENDDGVDRVNLVSGSVHPASGEVRVVDARHIEYSPRADFVGQDFFYYEAVNEHGRTTAKVTVTVTDDLPRFTRPPFRFPGQPEAITSADFDDNGLPDIAVLHVDEALSVLMQRPTTGADPEFELDPLTFEPRGDIVIDRELIGAIVSRDIDVDGRDDVVIAAFNDVYVYWAAEP